MNIEEDIRNLKAYIELVLEKNYCDCNELNVISYGGHCDGSKNVAKSIQSVLTAYENLKSYNKGTKEALKVAEDLEHQANKEAGDWESRYFELEAELEKEKEKNKKIDEYVKQCDWHDNDVYIGEDILNILEEE